MIAKQYYDNSRVQKEKKTNRVYLQNGLLISYNLFSCNQFQIDERDLMTESRASARILYAYLRERCFRNKSS